MEFQGSLHSRSVHWLSSNDVDVEFDNHHF